jgi:predicted dehydrogenase
VGTACHVADPMQRVLRSAVVGCGAISHEHLSFLSVADWIRLDAVCDLSPALTELARQRYGAGAAYTDIDEMLEVVRPDVVHVLTPASSHVDMVRRCLKAGAHVICEKPLALSASETRAILDEAEASGRVVVETRNLLFNDVVLELDRRIAADQIGQVREVEIALSIDLTRGTLADTGYRLPLGAAHDFMPHLAYLFLHFLDLTGDVDEVMGRVSNLSGHPGVGVDHVDVLISAGDRRGRIKVASDLGPDSFRLMVRGADGVLEAELYQPFVRHEGPPFIGKKAPLGQMVSGVQMAWSGVRNAKDKLLQHGTYHGVPRMLDAVYGALAQGVRPPIEPHHVLASAILVDRIAELVVDTPATPVSTCGC